MKTGLNGMSDPRRLNSPERYAQPHSNADEEAEEESDGGGRRGRTGDLVEGGDDERVGLNVLQVLAHCLQLLRELLAPRDQPMC